MAIDFVQRPEVSDASKTSSEVFACFAAVEKGMKSKTKKRGDNLFFTGMGLALIILVSLLDGFAASFVNAIQHIISDFTAELKVHAYIAGLVLLAYGIYRHLLSKK